MPPQLLASPYRFAAASYSEIESTPAYRRANTYISVSSVSLMRGERISESEAARRGARTFALFNPRRFPVTRRSLRDTAIPTLSSLRKGQKDRRGRSGTAPNNTLLLYIISYVHCLLTENTAMHVAHTASLRTSFCTTIIIKQRERRK